MTFLLWWLGISHTVRIRLSFGITLRLCATWDAWMAINVVNNAGPDSSIRHTTNMHCFAESETETSLLKRLDQSLQSHPNGKNNAPEELALEQSTQNNAVTTINTSERKMILSLERFPRYTQLSEYPCQHKATPVIQQQLHETLWQPPHKCLQDSVFGLCASSSAPLRSFLAGDASLRKLSIFS